VAQLLGNGGTISPYTIIIMGCLFGKFIVFFEKLSEFIKKF
jgi:hypothetical protein